MLTDRDVQGNAESCDEELKQAGVGNLLFLVGLIFQLTIVHQITPIYYDPAFIASLIDSTPIPESRLANRKIEDVVSLLYTSGSTGLPKGVIMLQGRELVTGFTVSRYLRLKPSDRMYTCMPLYHGAAHGLCVTPSLHAGSTVVLGRKFSHKSFWPEVRASKANFLQYVGELCRYLLNAPPHPLDRENNVQVAWGNGMR
jgi:acyl-CoA synthetase (AMP-forming)/AMP-acid ligase II